MLSLVAAITLANDLHSPAAFKVVLAFGATCAMNNHKNLKPVVEILIYLKTKNCLG